MALMEINWRPSAKMLRQFGVVGAAALAALAAIAGFRHSLLGIHLSEPIAHQVGQGLAWTAAAMLLLAIAAPRTLRPAYLLLTLVTLPIGWVVSHLLLAAIYFGIFTPVALLFRLIGRDALDRRIDPTAQTYWSPRKPVTDLKRYFRQF
ncbi:MAG: SxtJ family membrane protein [Planctomycetota bacterium]|nr:SxtJ family membrane protein [Planctomycetota bacterium]